MKIIGKYILPLLLTVVFIACGKGTPEKQIDVKDDPLPVKVIHYQMWESYSVGESTDPELIQELVSELKRVKVGDETRMGYDDFGDSVEFEYSDGTRMQYYFEGEVYVMDDGTRYETEGLDQVRDTLSRLIPVEY